MSTAKRSASHHLLSGGISGFASVICLQPLDLLKTRVQQLHKGAPTSLLQVTRDVLRTQGALGLWRGTGPTLARNVPGVAMYFYTLQTVRQTLATFPAFAASSRSASSPGTGTSVLVKASSQANLISGAVSRIGVGFLLNPFTVVKARFESDAYAYKNMSEALKALMRTSGIKGLAQGFSASALRDAPYAGLFVLVYEAAKTKTEQLLPATNISGMVSHGISGAVAGTIATTLTHPFDMIKTQMQLHDDPKYSTIRKTVVLVLRERGATGLLNGLSLRLSRKVFSSAIAWTVYEKLMALLKAP